MSMSPMEWRLRRGQYLGETSALCFLHLPHHFSSLPLLLAGTGSQILVYDLTSAKLLNSFQVFEGIRVHGISLLDTTTHNDEEEEEEAEDFTVRVAVFGEKRVKLFSLKFQSQPLLHIQLTLIHSLPKFTHWVLDVCFLKDGATTTHDYLAVGCSDNAVYFSHIFKHHDMFSLVCSERCLLYSMRMFGNHIGNLCIASGTIFNEIVVWKVDNQNSATIPGSHVEDQIKKIVGDDFLLAGPKYKDVIISRLVGHEGSIFRIAWFPNGLKLLSVSDDRSARIWEVPPRNEDSKKVLQDGVNHSKGPVLFGHSARIWDCCTFDSLIITAGEDCTCRVWDLDGRELNVIKEHVGRGVWRCLYDPSSSVLVTAGFDSAIKVHNLFSSSRGVRGSFATKNLGDREEDFAICIPNSSGHGRLMDSKKEYVRCLQFSHEDSLYVATNNGYLYHACLLNNRAVEWTELAFISKGAPIICMDLLSESSSYSGRLEDCIAIGDGKGSMTIVRVVGTRRSPKVEFTFTWVAEKERHLLGTYWCKAPDNRFIFTADPGGRLKLWKLTPNLRSASLIGKGCYDAFLVAEYVSCFGKRIMCVDASFTNKLLVCGDIHGNLLLYSLPNCLLCSTSVAAEVGASPPTNYFKGAHGVSSVCSVSIVGLCSDQVEICSTGADGCICNFECDRDQLNLEFMGLKQVKGLSAIRSVFSANISGGNYAVGFASENFIIWNLTSETKVTQITCGGWRRPHSYYLGDLPEMMNCFSFVKNNVIYIHRYCAPQNDKQIYPQNLHFQFHGREIHSLCFIPGYPLCSSGGNQGLVFESSWVATGCEDGTVRLTRYDRSMDNWSSSMYLGEHVGGSAVRSICSVSKVHLSIPDSIGMSNGADGHEETLEERENLVMLISVGSKRVVTTWKQMIRMSSESGDALSHEMDNKNEEKFTSSSSAAVSSSSFQWLSTDMPSKHISPMNRKNAKDVPEVDIDLTTTTSGVNSVGSLSSECRNMEINSCPEDDHENDWRYLDVTAFLVKDACSSILVCFVIVACSDATVTLRALVLPFRLWFDIALLASLSSPVLALEHVVIPAGNMQNGSIYLAITGSTDGNIAFWDLSECVENFMRRISGFKMESYMDFQKRPRTGRGSQGGRGWRSIESHSATRNPDGGRLSGVSVSKETSNVDLAYGGSTEPESVMENQVFGTSDTLLSERCNGHVGFRVDSRGSLDLRRKKDDLYPETCMLVPMHVLNNVHQSGVNCLHVSDTSRLRHSDSRLSFHVVSGGDDQAINCLRCELVTNTRKKNSQEVTDKIDFTNVPLTTNNYNHHCLIQTHEMQFVFVDKMGSAHSSAVKGVWTDGKWVFSVGLDQRVRCWKIREDKVREHGHLIISVPEPEAVDVKVCGRNHYQIAVAGRGMQMVEFYV